MLFSVYIMIYFDFVLIQIAISIKLLYCHTAILLRDIQQSGSTSKLQRFHAALDEGDVLLLYVSWWETSYSTCAYTLYFTRGVYIAHTL